MTGHTRLAASSADLPSGVAAVLGDPPSGQSGSVDAGDPPLLLLHGVTSNRAIWWRVGPALAASGKHVVAVDMPGHGQTRPGQRSHLFAVTAAELAAFIATAGLDRSDVAIVGHSWGGIVGAHLPIAGIRTAALVLLDPPVLTLDDLEALTKDPSEQRYATVEEASAAVRASNPTWSDGDVAAKARALTEFDEDFVRSVLLENGPYDGGMAALRDPNASGVPIWAIRGESASGGLIPESTVPAIESQLGPGRVVTIAGASHSPQRTHPEATVLAIFRALQVS